MKTWLHFIGRKYYPTSDDYRVEAEEYGCTRRIRISKTGGASLKHIAFGDRVLLAFKPAKKRVYVFGNFIIDTLSGLSTEATAALEAAGGTVTQTDPGGVYIDRGCGHYVTGPSYSIDMTLEDIGDILENLKENGGDPGKPMVGGTFVEEEETILWSVAKTNRGFREFDYVEYCKQRDESIAENKRGRPKVKGYFYTDADSEIELEQEFADLAAQLDAVMAASSARMIQEVQGYTSI